MSDSTSTKVPPKVLKPHLIDIFVKEGTQCFPKCQNIKYIKTKKDSEKPNLKPESETFRMNI